MLPIMSLKKFLTLVLVALSSQAFGDISVDDVRVHGSIRIEQDRTGMVLRSANTNEVIYDQVQQLITTGENLVFKRLGLYGVLDKNGAALAPAVYQSIDYVEERKIYVVGQDGFLGLMNDQGKLLSQIEFQEIDQYSDDKVWQFKKDGKAGVLNPVDGSVVVPAKFSTVRVFEPFILATEVSEAGSSDKRKHLFSMNGKYVKTVRPSQNIELWEGAGLAVVDHSRVVDVNGDSAFSLSRLEEIIPVSAIAIARFDDGYAVVNAEGELLSNKKYTKLVRVTGSLPGVGWNPHNWIRIHEEGENYRDNRFGAFSNSGVLVTDPIWESISQHYTSDGRAYFRVYNDEKYGSYSEEGNVLFPPKFLEAQFFGYDDPVAMVIEEHKLGLCDFSKGECPIPPVYDGLSWVKDSSLKDDVLVATKDGLKGLVNRNNEILVPFEFDDIRVPPSNNSLLSDHEFEAERDFFVRRFRFTKDEMGEWMPSEIPSSIIGEHAYDLHPDLVYATVALDARYIPEGLETEHAVLKAAQAGVLSKARYPSIQLVGMHAYVNFNVFSVMNKKSMPEKMLVCDEPYGFRLLNDVEEKGKHSLCAKNETGGLKFQKVGRHKAFCQNCAESDLPERWLMKLPEPLNTCEEERQMVERWGVGEARQSYAAWQATFGKAIAGLVDEATRYSWFENPSSGLFRRLVPSDSRAGKYLFRFAYPDDKGLSPSNPERLKALKHDFQHLVTMLQSAEPVAHGGIYPEYSFRKSEECAEVWYMRLPLVEDKARFGSSPGGFERYAVPQQGAFVRRRFPFLTFIRGKEGIRLVGISREFLEASRWVD